MILNQELHINNIKESNKDNTNNNQFYHNKIDNKHHHHNREILFHSVVRVFV